MPSAFRNPKNLADWLRLDYFNRRRRLPRLKTALCWAALLVTAAALGLLWLNHSEATLYQAGPLSEKHAMYSNDCKVCHVEAFTTAQRFLPWKQDLHVVPDAACETCHEDKKGRPHSPNQLKTDNCASCHQEHRGHASLTRMADSGCTSCHANINANSQLKSLCPINNVTGFPNLHPELRPRDKKMNFLEKDPGNIRFNHKKHVDEQGLMTKDGLKVLKSSLYPEGPNSRCLACHQEDSAGRYMLPIKYADHCASCHPLSVQLGGVFEDKKLDGAAYWFALEPAPHSTPQVVRGVLRERLLRFAEVNPLIATEGGVEGPRGKPGPKSGLEPDVTKMRWESIAKMTEADRIAFAQAQLALVEQLCFDRAGGCALCHVETTPRAIGRGLPEYAKSDLKDRWFDHGTRFDHRAHNRMACTDCHDAEKSAVASDILMPAKGKCAECHKPGNATARNDCAECHTYHKR
jgi:hypothetical protein